MLLLFLPSESSVTPENGDVDGPLADCCCRPDNPFEFFIIAIRSANP